MQVSVEEFAMLLGVKTIEIHLLQKQLQAAREEIARLTPAPAEEKPAGG